MTQIEADVSDSVCLWDRNRVAFGVCADAPANATRLRIPQFEDKLKYPLFTSSEHHVRTTTP